MKRGWNGGYWLKAVFTTLGFKAVFAAMLLVASMAALQPLLSRASAAEPEDLVQNVLTETLEDIRVTVVGKLPPNAHLELAPVDDEATTQALEAAGMPEATSLFAADITIVDEDGTPWQPDDLDVRVKIENLDVTTPAGVSVIHVLDEGEEQSSASETDTETDNATPADQDPNAPATETLDNSEVEGSSVSFDTGSFSVYIVAETTYLRTYRFFTLNEYGDYVEYPFYNDAGETTFTQTIKNGESPTVPQNPTDQQDSSLAFAGWYQGKREGATIVLEDDPYDFNNIPEITATEEVNLYARFGKFAYVIFHDQYDAATGTSPISRTERVELVEDTATVDISDDRVIYSGDQNLTFTGWSETQISTPGAALDDRGNYVRAVGDEITISGTTHLYPIFETAYWLSFYSGPAGSGATYYPETTYTGGNGPTTLEVPVRNDKSYSFKGWYASATLNEDTKEAEITTSDVQISDGEGNLIEGALSAAEGIAVVDGHIRLTKNVTLFAVWEQSNEVVYTIVTVKQKPTDEASISDAQKTYEYAESFKYTAAVGTTVTISDDFKHLDELASYNNTHPKARITDNANNPYRNYTFNAVRSQTSTTVTADGGAVIYVRLDWKEKPNLTASYTVYFNDTMEIEELKDPDLPTSVTAPYGTELADLVPEDPVCTVSGAYRFTGWYADPNCTTRAFFDNDEYQEYIEKGLPAATFATMPAGDVNVYAGWEEIRYKVDIDPNYGALAGTDSTYFSASYTNTIQEYTTVTRDYVESASGTWYYVMHSRTFDPDGDRKTYYTQDPTQATEFTTFEYSPGTYRYAGWYEVLENGSEVPYEFGQPVLHNTTLKLHWTKVGAYYIQYDAGLGTLNTDEELETVYIELDDDSYADSAFIVITRRAQAPEGYEFVGWQIRGDESGTLYYPGQEMTLLTKDAATVLGKKTIYLDAVYTQVATANIVYHANGATIDASALDYGDLPADAGTSYDADAATYSVSRLENNSEVDLSNGSGLTMENAVFAGWCKTPVYDPDDETAPLLVPGADTFNVDTATPVDLYAIWKVQVSFNLNADGIEASFGTTSWGDGYTLVNANTYTTYAYIGSTISWPPFDPVCGGGQMFLGWSEQSAQGSEHYDFSQEVTGPLDLYAQWGEKARAPFVVLDSSDEVIVTMDGEGKWGNGITITVDEHNHQVVTGSWDNAPYFLVSGASHLAMNANTLSSYNEDWTVSDDYVFAFATVATTDGVENSQIDAKPILEAYYNSQDGKVHVLYEGGTDAALGDDEVICFIYYTKKQVEIHYVVMDDAGYLTTVTTTGDTPGTSPYLSDANDTFDMGSPIANPQPLAWASNVYEYYSFAVGDGGFNAYNLSYISAPSTSDDSLPTLKVQNGWRQFQYSVDGGQTWYNCGYEPHLYVVYFTKQPTIVSFQAKTLGYQTDKLLTYVFDYQIYTVDYATGDYIRTEWDTREDGHEPLELQADSINSRILFTEAEGTEGRTTQQVDIQLRDITSIDFSTMQTTSVKDQFTTTVNGSETDEYTYTANIDDELGKTQDVTFINTREAQTIEIHVAQIEAQVGQDVINLRDNWRSDNNTISVALGAGDVDFREALPASSFVTNADEDYVFGAIIMGTDNDEIVIPAAADGSTNVAKIAFEEDSPGSGTYDLYVKDAEGNRVAALGNNKIYYLYSPMMTIHYMLESDNNELTPIVGADGENITYSGSVLTLNGMTVQQCQKLAVPMTGLTISQTVNGSDFNMPPLLDNGSNQLDLVYDKIGLASQDEANEPATNIDQLEAVSEGKTVYFNIDDSKLSWSFDGTTWTGDNQGGSFDDWAVVYVIYRERGYDLTVKKDMSPSTAETGYTEPFTVTLTSTAINRTSYSVEGTGNSTIDAIYATDDHPGSITFTVTEGSVVKIFGLGAGHYTLTETDNANFTLTATTTVEAGGGTQTTADADVTSNSTIAFTLDGNMTVGLTNTSIPICKIGDVTFPTLTAAIEWIKNNNPDAVNTIEMLCDYLQPASDAPEIPDYLNVTLTSASGGTYAITRKASFTSGYMLTNHGTLKLQNVTLDGGSFAAAGAMVGNDGDLTITTGATLTGAINLGDGGAIDSWGGSVTVSGGSIEGNAATNGAAIHASGGTVTVSGGSIAGNVATEHGGGVHYAGTSTVTVKGGTTSGNQAHYGAGIYMAAGTLSASAGSVVDNAATADGGAVYAANATINVSGTAYLGTDGHANTAQNGAGIYLNKGTVTISGGYVTYNVASLCGGGVYADQGTVTVQSGGCVNGNAATELYGGGIYVNTASVTLSSTSAKTTSVSENRATNGGGIYTVSGSITLSGNTSGTTFRTQVNGNEATSGNGGGIYSVRSSVTVNKVEIANNKAAQNGGGLWSQTDTVSLKNGFSMSGNKAQNGAALFTENGTLTFNEGTVSGNEASNGGAVGVATTTAQLNFAGNIKIQNNKLITGDSSVTANVYLDQDTDGVINAAGLGGSAYVGIYVPGETDDTLVVNRGLPGSYFGVYTSTSNVGKFKNDRTNLEVQTESLTKKLKWVKTFTVEVRYVASMADALTTMPSVPAENKKSGISYSATSGTMGVSEIAVGVRSQASTAITETAVFAAAFTGTSATPAFSDYITDVYWSTDNSRWEYVKRDESTGALDKLIIYFSEPTYISIENNTIESDAQYTLDISSLMVNGHTAINDPTSATAGYGYVFAKNDEIQSALYPIKESDLLLAPGGTIKLLFPGGLGADFSLSGAFEGAEAGAAGVACNMTGQGATTVSSTEAFTLSGTLENLTDTAGTYEIVFGGKRSICRIIAGETDATSSDYSKKEPIVGTDTYEYTFSSLNQAKDFANTYLATETYPGGVATIEMLTDYLVSTSDNVNFPVRSKITLTTAIGGTYCFAGTDDPDARAKISRDTSNVNSLITVTSTDTGNNENTELTVRQLNFDGKSIGEDINGGIIKTMATVVTVEDCDFVNCKALNGGAMYIKSRDVDVSDQSHKDYSPVRSLVVRGCVFDNCETTSKTTKDGGGAVWVNTLTLEVRDCIFRNCSAVDQGGALFHRIDDYIAGSKTVISGCTVSDCTAKAAGGMETDACDVTLENSTFTRCSASQRNGGGFNVYSNNSGTSGKQSSLVVRGCTFDDCHADTQNGGGLRSAARYTTVTDCVVTNCSSKNGGGISSSNDNSATRTIINNCTIDNCLAYENGGGINCISMEFIIDDASEDLDYASSITGCTAMKKGGGIYNAKNSDSAKLTIANLSIENCKARGGEGGGIYSLARTMVLDAVSVKGSSATLQGGGCYLPSAKSITAEALVISGCEAGGAGGGLYQAIDTNAQVSISGASNISNNRSGGKGGGLYVMAAKTTITGASVADNYAPGAGGGICHEYDSNSNPLTLDACTITGNTSGSTGGGVYTLAGLWLKGGISITSNNLAAKDAKNAAGVYMQDGRSLIVGDTQAAGDTTTYDSVTVRENYTTENAASDLRMPETSDGSHNSNCVTVKCGLNGEIRVVNAKVRGTEFGVSDISYPYGFSDLFSVFKADDNTLYGILKRSDNAHKQIIWAEDPVCKITDASGKLLYLDVNHTYPAVFDQLDSGNINDTTYTTAFGSLRNTSPQLYQSDGTLYTGATYKVQMLSESYKLNNPILSNTNSSRSVIFTSAGTKDSLYPFSSTSATRCTITASESLGDNPMMTVGFNLTLTGIALDANGSVRAAGENTRVIETNDDAQNIKITLSRNATLLNANCTGVGGGVYLSGTTGQSLLLEGGAIRNCSAADGGGVYQASNGIITIKGGNITKCSAVDDEGKGGGIYLGAGNVIMSGGSIMQCTAAQGAGLYIADGSSTVNMSGGSIYANTATEGGGGILVGDGEATLNFSGAPYVYDNVCGVGDENDCANNVQMDQAFDEDEANPHTIIHSKGLIRGAAIGVYVPGDEEDESSLYSRFGVETKPFATFEDGTSTDTLHYFINDRNGLKGGCLTAQVDDDQKIYWIKIYSLELTCQVVSDNPEDTDKEFKYSVALSGTAEGYGDASNLNGTFGDMSFVNGEAQVYLTSGQTAVADLLPLGYSYTVTQIDMTDEDKAYFTTTPSSYVATGSMDNSTQYVYSVTFYNLHAVCKVTDASYGLLYYKDAGEYKPAVFSQLSLAFNKLRHETFYSEQGGFYNKVSVNTVDTRVEMLVEDYSLTSASGVTFNSDTKALLTTADAKAIDGFPYVGTGTAKITRAYSGSAPMIAVNGDLTLGEITLDGGNDGVGTNQPRGTSAAGSGIFKVNNGGTLTLGTGATLRNSKVSSNDYGAGIYLYQGATLNISGNPIFSNNVAVSPGSGAKNGGETYNMARQDIYIAGYKNTEASSLVVTGDITAREGSIWVWCAQVPHYKHSNQFALLEDESYTGVTAFRNARKDSDSENPLAMYLTGVVRDGYVLWTGTSELTVSKTITGRVADKSRSFEFTLSGLTAGESYVWKRSTIDGSTWVGYAGVATDSSGTLVADADGAVTFRLRDNEHITIDVPATTVADLSEDNGLYVASYVLDGAESVEACVIEGVLMSADHTIDFTNDFSTYAETGLDVRTTPYLGLVLTGAIFALGAYINRSRREETTVGRVDVPLTDISATKGAHFYRGKHFRGGGGAH